MIKFLTDSFDISPEEAEILSSCFLSKEYKKGDKFLKLGEVSNKIGFIEKGLMKCVLIGSSKEVVDDFVFERQFVANYHSFLTKTKSKKELVCMKNSTVRIAHRNQLEELGERHPFMERIARLISESLFISTHQKLENIRLLSAEERYLQLFESNREILQEIPQYEIASYLNVSPETVSRIRNSLKNRS